MRRRVGINRCLAALEGNAIPDACGVHDTHTCHMPMRHIQHNTETDGKRKDKTDRTSRQIQTGISHSAPTHRGGHVLNRNRRRQLLRAQTEQDCRCQHHKWTKDEGCRMKDV